MKTTKNRSESVRANIETIREMIRVKPGNLAVIQNYLCPHPATEKGADGVVRCVACGKAS